MAVHHRQSEDPADRFASQKNVCANVQVIGKRQILINRFDSAVSSLLWIIEFYFFSCVSQAASIRVVDAGDYLNQCRFTRSVVSGKGQNFTR
jgi:hypothetical protein